MTENSRQKAGVSAKTVRGFGLTSLSILSEGHPAKIIGFAKITRDLSERKEAEQKLEKAREISLQSQKLEAIGQLTGGIAHDFNNLLTAILGSLELLRKRLPTTPDPYRCWKTQPKGQQRGKTLTNRMLAFARNQELKHEVIDIPELVQGMTELLRTVTWLNFQDRDPFSAWS